MPKGMAAAVREAVAKENRDDLQLERTPWGRTGFVNVVEVKGKYQARLQVPGDGRAGSLKRKQHALPGLFDTAEEAAVWLAVVKRDMKAHNNGKLVAPPKQDKPHKQRSSQLEAPLPAAPTPEPLSMPAQRPLAVAYAVPMPLGMLHMPCVVASPVP